MSHVKIWIHTVWCTKNHVRILSNDVRQQLFDHIRKNAKEKQIHSEYEEFIRKFDFTLAGFKIQRLTGSKNNESVEMEEHHG